MRRSHDFYAASVLAVIILLTINVVARRQYVLLFVRKGMHVAYQAICFCVVEVRNACSMPRSRSCFHVRSCHCKAFRVYSKLSESADAIHA